MSGYDAAMAVLVIAGLLTALAALWTVRQLDRVEREIAARKSAGQAAE